MKNQILVTGSQGYIGRHLSRLLEFTGLDQEGGADLQVSIEEIPKVKDQLEDVETIIHLADRRLQHLNKDNIDQQVNTHKLFIDSLKDLPKLNKLVFASSCSVYGQNEEEINETAPIHLTSHYAECKFRTEELLKESGLRYVILRFGTCYGAVTSARDDLFINRITRSAIENEDFEVFGVDSWRPYIHVVDFARALSHFAKSKIVDRDPINISQVNLTKRQILSKLNDLNLDTNSIVINESKPDLRNYRIIAQKSKDLGMTYAYDFEKGLAQLIENLRAKSVPLI